MKWQRMITATVAAMALGGCATYDQIGSGGGYYQGRPEVRYYGTPGYGGYGGYYGYGSYYYNPYTPYYRHYSPYYPHYRPPARPQQPHHGQPGSGHGQGHYVPPPGSGPGGNRPAPWRDPTQGRWREHGQQPALPGHPPRVTPGASSQPGAKPPDTAAPPRIRVRGGRVQVLEP